MRKLATIRIIDEILHHPNADALELARLGGWQVVVKKGEMKAGDRCVYCEIDSVLPERPPFAFLRERGFRIKTIKLRGAISQGICFPSAGLETEFPGLGAFSVGDDVTEFLGVVKFEPPLPAHLMSTIKGAFPSFLRRTDEERVQNLTELLPEFQTKSDWVVTEKLDGTSFTCFLYEGMFGVCSRNFELIPSDGNLYWEMARKLCLEEKLRGYGKDLALQGEIIGGGVQGNKYQLKSQELFVFNVFDILAGRSLDLKELCSALQLKHVPILTEFSTFPWKTVDEIIAYAPGQSVLAPVAREGVVIRTRDHQTSFKSINNNFLLKHME